LLAEQPGETSATSTTASAAETTGATTAPKPSAGAALACSDPEGYVSGASARPSGTSWPAQTTGAALVESARPAGAAKPSWRVEGKPLPDCSLQQKRIG